MGREPYLLPRTDQIWRLMFHSGGIDQKRSLNQLVPCRKKAVRRVTDHVRNSWGCGAWENLREGQGIYKHTPSEYLKVSGKR